MPKMSLTPLELLAELLGQRTVTAEDTKEFSKYEHDKHLLPMLQSRIDEAMDIYKKRYVDLQDLQGIRDDGCDLLLRYTFDDAEKKAALQVKSYREIDEWLYEPTPKVRKKDKSKAKQPRIRRTKTSLTSVIKQQMYDATFTAKAEDIYVILCGDASKHKRGLRLISATLKTHPDIKVVQPVQALSLLKMSDFDIGVFVDNYLYEGDLVFSKALQEINSKNPLVILLNCAFLFYGLEENRLIEDRFLYDIIGRAESWAEELAKSGYDIPSGKNLSKAMAEATERVIGSSIVALNSADGMYEVSPQDFPAFSSKYYEQKVRYKSSNAQEYLVWMIAMNSIDRVNDEDEEDEI